MSGKNLDNNKLVYYLFRDLFFVSGFCLLFLLIIEDVQPGFVSFWFDFKYVLLITAVSGILTLFTSGKKSDKMDPPAGGPPAGGPPAGG